MGARTIITTAGRYEDNITLPWRRVNRVHLLSRSFTRLRFEMGWYPAMIIPDHKTIYPAGKPPDYYAPRNYDGTFHKGFAMTARNAIANSFNIPAIDTLEFAGIPNVLNMAARMGLT